MRIALVAGPDPGHLLPTAGLAAALRGAGHETVVCTTPRWQVALDTAGLGFVDLPLLPAEDNDRSFGQRLAARPAQMARPLAEALAGFAPDVIVSDTLTRAGALASALLAVPWVELIPHNLTDPSCALPPFGSGWASNPLRDKLFRALAARSSAAGRRERALACAAAGLIDPAPVTRLIATLPALEPRRPDWPERAVVVGPLGWEAATVDLPLPRGSAPVVLVVGSSASRGGADLLGPCVEQLTGVRIVSPRFSGYGASLPDHVRAGPGRLAPLLEAASVVVSSAGHGMVAAALRAGKPLVMVPGAGDQKEVAARTARLGAGVVSRPNRLGPSVWRVLGEPSFAACAGRAGDVAGAAAPVAWVEWATGICGESACE